VDSDRLREIWRMKDDIKLLEHEIRDLKAENENVQEEVEKLKVDDRYLRSKLHVIKITAELETEKEEGKRQGAQLGDLIN